VQIISQLVSPSHLPKKKMTGKCLIHVSYSYTSSAVADSGQWMGCISSHVHTNDCSCRYFDCMTMDKVKNRWTNISKMRAR
jgi:hypothetical protein